MTHTRLWGRYYGEFRGREKIGSGFPIRLMKDKKIKVSKDKKNVKVPTDLHQRLKIESAQLGISLEALLEKILYDRENE